jgi:AcrR family transcriptional regulator
MAEKITLEAIRKSQILDAAVKTLSDRGSRNVTLDDVARASGLSKGGVTHYYRNKDELFKASFRAFFDRIFQRGREEMDRHDEPMEKLLSFTWIINEDDSDIHLGYPLLFDAMSLASHDEEYRALLRDWFARWVALLKEALEEGVRKGQFTISDFDGTARAISAAYQGVATRWYLDREAHSSLWAMVSLRSAITGLLEAG